MLMLMRIKKKRFKLNKIKEIHDRFFLENVYAIMEFTVVNEYQV